MIWTAWYPALDGANEHELSIGVQSENWFSIGPAAQDAPVSAACRRYPIVLLSHGTGGATLNLEWLARDLARRGFIAVGIDHHGNTFTQPYRAEAFLCWWERARDLTLLLDHMETEQEFAGRLDIDRAFVAGYSLGGCTAAALLGAISENSRFQPSSENGDFARGVREFPDLADRIPGLIESSSIFRDSWSRMSNCYRDPRFKAALLMAPGRSALGFNEASLKAIDAPVHIVVGGADFALPAARWLHQRLATSRLDLLAAEVGHHVFLAEATAAGRLADPETCIDPASVDRGSIHQQTAAWAAELFGQ